MSYVSIKMQGMEELTKACEDCASPATLQRTNKKIVKRASVIVKEAMQKHVPVSADNSKSGREGFRPGGHAKPNIPIGPVRVDYTVASAEVGWKLSDRSEYFYMKFVEWGTTKMAPRDFIEVATKEAENPMTEVARQEYEALLKQTIGG